MEPDGLGIRWEVTGPDADDFTIDAVGALKFKTPPDYENPTDRDLNLDPSEDATTTQDGEFTGEDNMYQVTVRATEMSAVGGGPAKSTELDVTVDVQNVDEDGAAELQWLQPMVGTPIMANPTDPDSNINNITYIWYKSKVGSPDLDPDPDALSDEWESVDGTPANAATYTPIVDDATTPNDNESDVGKYLLVRVDYTDETSPSGDPDRVAVAISANKVLPDVDDAENNSPDFGTGTTTRTVPEDTAVGDPVGSRVVVDINEDGDTLTYEIVMTADGNADVVVEDLAFFDIDKESGQLRVKQQLSHEATDGRTYEGDTARIAGEYTIVVRATDPSGETGENRDDITVTIMASRRQRGSAGDRRNGGDLDS